MKCKYNMAWYGVCGEDCNEVNICEKHKKKCHTCGEQATHECEMASSLVCGISLCDKHVYCNYHTK